MLRSVKSLPSVVPNGSMVPVRRLAMSTPFFSEPTPPLQKNNWTKDTVYLYQFPRSPVVPNLSPYCLKLETWLRVKKILHEVNFTIRKRSKFGLLPFVELNGEHLADSQLIIHRLEEHFQKKDDLSPEQTAIARAIDRMIEGSTAPALLWSRVVENTEKMLSKEVTGMRVPHFLIHWIVAPKMRKTVAARIRGQGYGKFSREERLDMLRRDIGAVDGILGDKDFLFGNKPMLPDITVFGHLASCYYLPYRQPIQDLLDEEFPRVKHQMERVRSHFWPDWPLEK